MLEAQVHMAPLHHPQREVWQVDEAGAAGRGYQRQRSMLR